MRTAEENRDSLKQSVEAWNRERSKDGWQPRDLSAVEFVASDLRGANFTRCILRDARFIETNVDGADFAGAVLDRSIFARVDLLKAEGLALAECRDWISFDAWTLTRSRGSIPQRLLRQAGLEDIWVQAFATVQPYYTCFVSYPSQESDFTQVLTRRLRARGVAVWFAPDTMPAGSELLPTMVDAARDAERLIVVMSHAALKSGWVPVEVYAALGVERSGIARVVPISLDDSYKTETDQKWVAELAKRNVLDMSGWATRSVLEDGVERLLKVLRRVEPA